MDFGRVDASTLSEIDFKLPPDPPQTSRVLAASPNRGKPEVFVGCAKWGRPDWVGKLYPKGTKASDFLHEYAKNFNCIELNSIFYKLPSITQVKSWKSKVGKDFKFCPKFSDVITHLKRLKNVRVELDKFLEVIYELGDNCGPLFLMPHPQMGPTQFETIESFMTSLPKDLDVFLEFRHPSWFTPPHYGIAFDWLEKNNFGAVITDVTGRRDCVHMHLTKPEAFIRFVGNSLHPSDYERIDDWVQRINRWLAQGLSQCYFFMHQHEELHSPELCKYLIEELNKECNLSLQTPKFITRTTLFD